MNKTAMSVGIAAAAILLSQAAQADRVKGSARADFRNDELQVPCVMIEGYGDAVDGQFFDIVLKRRGKSFNYELAFAEPEDAAMCEDAANYATFIDEDDDDDDDDDDNDDVADDDSSDDDADDDDSLDVASLFASCEVRHEAEEQTRSRAKVKARNLVAGEYYAVLTSGDNSIQSEVFNTDDDELEIEFDSAADDVAEGAEPLEPGFVQDKSLTAALFDAATDEELFSETVSCRVKSR